MKKMTGSNGGSKGWMGARLAAVVLGLNAAALAGDGAWVGASGGNWSDAANWLGGGAYASGTGATAYFTNGAPVTVWQDLGSLTLGNLYFANASTLITNNAVTLNGGGTSTVTVDGGAVTASVSVALSPAAGTTLRKAGAGTLLLGKPAGAGTSFSGVTLDGGLTLLGSGVGGDGLNVGSGTITINPGTTLRYLDNNLINNYAVIDVKGGGVLDVKGFTDNIGAITGDGVVSNMTWQLFFWLNGATRKFSGLCYGGGNLFFMQPGVFVAGGSNSLQNVTFNLAYPGLLAFAPGVGTYYVGTLATTNQQTLALQDTDGGAITLALGSRNENYAVVPTLAGPGGLAKEGSGTITLTNAHAYAGATKVNGGILRLGDGVNDGAVTNSAGVTVGVTGTLAFNTLASQTNSLPLYGSGSLTKAQASSLALAAYNMSNGTVAVNAGTLAVNGGNYIGGSFTANSGALLAFNGGSGTGATLNVAGAVAGPIRITGGNHQFASPLGLANARYEQTGGSSQFIGARGDGNTNLIFVTVSGGTMRVANVGDWPQGLGLQVGGSADVTISDFPSKGQRLASDGKSHEIIVTNNASLTADSLRLISPGSTASTGTLTLAGGTFAAGSIINAVDTSTNSFVLVNFNGGLLKLTTSTTIAATPYSTFKVLEGGARIDGGSLQTQINQPLVNGTGGADGGLAKSGASVLVLITNATYTGQTTVKAGTLRTTSIGGAPFGGGSVFLDGGTLQAYPAGSGLAVGLTAADGTVGNTLAYGAGPSALGLSKGSDSSVTLTLGNSGAVAESVLVRTNRGVLAIAPASGTAALGSTEKLMVNGGVRTVNGMASAVFGIHNDDRRSCDFLTYGGSGFQTATYVAGLDGGAASLANVTANTATDSKSVYALRVHNGAILTINSGQTLTVGDGVNPAGVIINNSSSTTAGITGGTLDFGASEGVVVFNQRRSDQNGPTLNSVVTGSNGLTLVGGGPDEDLVLGSAGNTYSGGTRIMAGRVSLANAQGFSGGDVFIYGNEGWGGQFLFNFAGTLTNTFHLSGVGPTTGSLPAGAVRFDANGTLSGPVELMADTRVGTPTVTAVGTLSGSVYGPYGFEVGCPGQAWGKILLTGVNTYSGTTRVSGGTLEIGAGGTLGAGPVVNNATLAFSGAGNVTVTNPISGTGRVVQNGSGTLTLSGANACSGSVEVNSGTLVVKDASLSTSGLSVSGTLDLGGQSLTLGRLAGSGTVSNSVGGTVALTVGAGNADGLFWGAIRDGAGATALNKTGAGTLVLSGLNTYSGATVIGGGTVKLQGVPTAPLTNGLAYQLDASDLSKLTVDGSNVTTWADSAAAGVSFTQSVSVLQPVYVTNTVNGHPAVRFEGMTNCLGANKAATVQTAFFVNRVRGYMGNGGLWGQNNGDNSIRQASLTAWNHPGNGNDFSCGGQMFINGIETNQLASNTPHILTAIAASPKNWFNALGDCRPYNGTLFRSYKGDVCEVLAYTSALATADRQAVEAYLNYKWFNVGLLSPTNVLPMATALVVSNNAALDLNGVSQAVASLSGAGTVGNGSALWSTLTVGGDNSSALFAGVIAGSNALVKTGSGTFTLSGANTYAGSTLVSDGTLRLAGGANRLPASGAVTLAAGATLDLSGQAQTLYGIGGSGAVVGGGLTVTGVVAPGGAGDVGTLTLAATPVLSGTLLVDARANGACDLLSVTGDLNLSALALQVADAELMSGYSYTIATCTGNLTGSFTSSNLPKAWTIQYNRTSGAGQVMLVHNLGTLISIR